MGNKTDLQTFFDLGGNLCHIRPVFLRHQNQAEPAFFAARSFSLRPPMGRTLPRSVISPVMAISARTGSFVIAEVMAVAIVIPAEGPSLGTVPPECGYGYHFP